MSERFWRHLDVLVAEAEVVIDRPAGSAHPRYPNFIYPLDYGYVRGTTAVDAGAGVDGRGGEFGASPGYGRRLHRRSDQTGRGA